MKVNVSIDKLRLISKGKKAQKPTKKGPTSSPPSRRPTTLLQTSTNTCDLRGQRVDEAKNMMWKFMDSAILRGEHGVILIHGHGDQELLKNNLRTALAHESPYEIHFQAGKPEDGGDGVTLIFFKK